MWAIDFGTTNTLLARWDERGDRPEVVELPAIARKPAHDGEQVSRGVPSALHVVERPSFWARVGQAPLLARNAFWGRLAHIGRPALELNAVRHRPAFVPTFKRRLAMSPLATVARATGRSYTAREVAYLYLRELFAEAHRQTGQRIRELTVTAPVESFETYRAEVATACKRLGVRKLSFLDEPVAAALGYGLGLSRERRALVVDFGGGTFHLALLRLAPGQTESGRADVLAKAGRDVGGNLVDRWLLDEFCKRLDYVVRDDPDDESRLWAGLMLAEACRVKEAIYFDERATFHVVPRGPKPDAASLELDRAGLVDLLRARGLYDMLDECLRDVLAQAAKAGAGGEVDDVLMVGGSTLLPEVYPFFEQRFGRGKVRAWQPFEAVVNGAAVFAAGRVVPADFIVHDYALLTYGLQTKEPEYTIVVPRGTSFPTKANFWKRQLVPTCALGEPERVFKLIVCEIGRAAQGTHYVWDADGRLHALRDQAGQSVVVKLNESNPALGTLDPPHSPRDKNPRLEIGFGVDENRWLCATIVDLKTHRHLMRDEPVVRLL